MSKNINIAASNIVGKCDLKCSYSFKYKESNSTAKNDGVMISLTYESASVAQVTYNQQKYNVGSISIISPSIHDFNNKSMPGELIIEHIPEKGGNLLKVCIPFTSSIESSSASQIITDIIKLIASNAPSKGNSTNLNISNFSLEKIVPRKPFFTYTEGSTYWLVYGDLDAIPLTSSTISTLQKIIKPYQLKTNGDLYYNSKGPVSGVQIGDGIYISCQPTGSSKEQTTVTYDKPKLYSTINFDNIFEDKTIQTIILIIVMFIILIVLFYGINFFYNYLGGDANKLQNPLFQPFLYRGPMIK